MKIKGLIFLVFALIYSLNLSAQILKGSATLFFEQKAHMDAFSPNLPYGAELAFVLADSTLYRWSRDLSEWAAYLPNKVYVIATAADTTTISDPRENDVAYVDSTMMFIRDTSWLLFSGGTPLPDSLVYQSELEAAIDTVVSGSGTSGYLALWNAARRLTDSPVSVSGNVVTVEGSGAALRLNPTTAPANTEGVIYANDASNRLRYMDGVDDHSLAYVSELTTNNTSTDYVPYWDGDSFENSGMHHELGRVLIGTTTSNDFRFRVNGGASYLEDGVVIGGSSGSLGTKTKNDFLRIESTSTSGINSNTALITAGKTNVVNVKPAWQQAAITSSGTPADAIGVGDPKTGVSNYFPLSGKSATSYMGYTEIPVNEHDDIEWNLGGVFVSALSNEHTRAGSSFSISLNTDSDGYNGIGVFGHASISDALADQVSQVGGRIDLRAGNLITDYSLNNIAPRRVTSLYNPTVQTHGLYVVSSGVFDRSDTLQLSELLVDNFGIKAESYASRGDNYGVYIKADSNDINWGLYVHSGKAYFADTTQVATLPNLASPTYNLVADANGVVHSTTPSHATLKETTSQALASTATYTHISSLDTTGVGKNVARTDSTITVQTVGTYRLRYNFSIEIAASGGGTWLVQFQPYTNAATIPEALGTVQVVTGGAETWRQVVSGETIIDLSASDVISLRYTATAGPTYTLYPGTITLEKI